MNLIPGSPISELIDEFMKDNKEERRVEDLRIFASDATWELFVKLFLQYTVQTNVWKAQHGRVELSKFVTVWDEAFALVALESNMKLWMHQAAGKNKEEEKGMELYVVKGKTKNNTNKRVRIGWTMEGRKRYNEICDAVEANREKEESKRKEDVLLKKWGGGNSQPAVSSDDEDEDDMWDAEQREIEKFEPRGGF